MNVKKRRSPEKATGEQQMAVELVPRLGNKTDVARMVGASQRSINNYMQRGMPFMRLSARKVVFDLADCAHWFKSKFSI